MIVLDGVHISGPVNLSVARLLRYAIRHDPAYARLLLTVRREVEAVIDDCETIGTRWLGDAAKADSAVRRAVLNQPGRIGTAAIAELLSISKVWARQRCSRGDWNAVKDGNRWTADRAAVLDEAEQRRRAA
ncbi:hypothetical protein O3S80_21430 [Streptomyces sp. Lzd4kr]|nr:hypothetical protein [Streptomyces sp. Lzd4kr]